MTSHKLKSSLHIVIQKRNGWKGEESMRGWKGGRVEGGAAMQFYLLATVLPDGTSGSEICYLEM